MEEEILCSSLPHSTDSVLQQPQQDSWTSIDHRYINGEQEAIVWDKAEVQINQAHGTDLLNLSPKEGQESPEEAEPWEQIIWSVRPMTCTNAPLSFATVQWDVPGAFTPPLVTDRSLANELSCADVTSLASTSPQSEDDNAALLTQEEKGEQDGFDSQLLTSDAEWAGNGLEPRDAADVQEPTIQEKEDSTHELSDSNNEIALRIDSEEEEGCSETSDPVEAVDLIDTLEETESSEDEAESFVDLKLQEDQEEPGVLLTGEGDSEERQTSENGVEVGEDNEEGGEEEGEEQGVANVSCTDESEEAKTAIDVEVSAEPLQTDDTGLTLSPDELIDLQQSEVLKESCLSGTEEEEIPEQLHEEPARLTDEPEMCKDVDQNVDTEQSEAVNDDEEASTQEAGNTERTEISQEIPELTENLEESSCLEQQDCDQTTSQEREASPQPERSESEQLEMTKELEPIQAEVSHQTEEQQPEDSYQLGQSQHLEQLPQMERTELSTQPENAEQAEESSPSEQGEESTQSVQEEESSPSEQIEESTPSEQEEESTPSEQEEESTPSEQEEESTQSVQEEESTQSVQEGESSPSEQIEESTLSEQGEESSPPEQREESSPPEQTVCAKAEDPEVAEQQEQTEPTEQPLQKTDSSPPTLAEQPVPPENSNEKETAEQLSPETEVTQRTAEAEATQVGTQAEASDQAEEVRGTEDTDVQTVVENGEQPKPAETDVPHMNGGEPVRDMARRLAERLFNLDGIQRVDVVKHLDKDNDFSRAVGEEYLKLFDFTGQTLDHALRSFLKVVILIGETQERERVLQHFACRFHQCNPDSFSSPGAVLALTCALMLLNTDLHGQHVGKAMSSSKFVSNLDGMNEGEKFSKDLLKSLYNSIKSEPLEWAVGEEELKNSVLLDEDAGDDAPLRSKANPFQDVPHDKKASVVKEGFLQRKLHADIDGKRTPWGKRGWKTFYGVLRGMVLYLQKDDYRRDQQTSEEVVSVHHSLAEQASDYTKKPHVFRLQTADWRVFLFQASSKVEMNSWISRINLVSALHSSPPFPAAVGSQRKFFRPILPASQSAHTRERQLQSHAGMLESFRADLSHLMQKPPEGKKARAKELEEHRVRAEYLQYEMCRYEIYIQVLEAWKSADKTGNNVVSTTDLTLFDKTMCADAAGEEEDEEGGMKKSHSSPSLELEMVAPTVVKVKRNISERRTYRKTIIPRWNKEA